jgi:hypothetical protein
MKVATILLSLLFCISISNAQKKPAEIQKINRIEKVINSQWTFNYIPSETADKGYELPGFNDSKWPAISLPHTWNSYETTGELRPFTRSPGETGETYWWTGWGWYRKHFSVGSEYADRKVFIEFEGVQKYCKVWINGKYAGDHKGGYGSFDFDITGFLRPGADNVIAVAVSNLQKDEFRVHSLTEGSYNVSCGIYRNVTLVLKNQLYIPMQGSANHEGGTLITSPVVSDNEGVVNIKTWVKNDYPQSRICVLQTSITDTNNQVIELLKTEADIESGQIYMFDQTSKPVKNPRLWSPEDPYLYSVYSEVTDRKQVTDNSTGYFSFRESRLDEKDHSFYLNNKKTELKGINRHQEYPWLGDAVPGWLTEFDLSDISGKNGYNFFRTVNSPAVKNLYEQADKHGIIAEEDFSVVTLQGFSPEEQKQQIREMIRRDRNHPSIIAWSPGDEPGRSENEMFAASEDSTRSNKSIGARVDPDSGCFIFRNGKSLSDVPSSGIGEPARIILTSSHRKIVSDRGSVVLIRADITDSKGHHVPGAKNTIKWKVSGPAKLVGPASYISYADSNRRSDEGWYIEMPATNIIRSGGKPGKIEVTVFSSGLASGTVEIESEEIETDNSVIGESSLSDEGRKPVVIKLLVTERLEEIPQEIAPATTDFILAASDKKGFDRIMSDYIIKNNPSADTLSVEFRTLSALLATQLSNNEGKLSSSDYNFNAGHYNTCRLISGYIAKTKLPALFKESLRQYYSKLMIWRGNEKNAGDEMNWLNWIPSGGVVVIVPDENTSMAQKGVIFTKQTGLSDIIKAVYPQFTKFSDEAKQRALIFIGRMNPSVHISSLTGDPDPGSADPVITPIFTAEKGKPILIPDYKFISE